MPPLNENLPVLLALETSGDVCGLALFRDSVLLAEYNFRHSMHLSEHLLDILDALLKQFGLTLKDVSVYAVGIGPGSFTGTRMGVMTAKMFAYLENKPLYGIDSLTALASEFSGLVEQVLFPILSCRSETVYTAPFRDADPFPKPAQITATYTLEQVVELIQQQSESRIVLCGEGATRHKAYLSEALAATDKRVSFMASALPKAVQIGVVALSRWHNGDTGEDALELVPEYIAPPPISQPKKGFSLVNTTV